MRYSVCKRWDTPQISAIKGEPAWMRDLRLKAFDIFLQKPMPTWGGNVAEMDFNNIYYYVKPSDREGRTWDDVPENIKKTFDRLGIPEAEKTFLAGVGAQYDSEVIYHSLKEDLQKLGVIFSSPDQALQEHPDLVREYFGTIIPPEDNKFAALNTAVWSGGSFIYVPPGVKVDVPLQAYFRINSEEMGQFERTLIIVGEGAQVHYVEGCTAPHLFQRIAPQRRGGNHLQTRLTCPLHHDSELGLTMSITSSPSVPWPMSTPRWNGWMAISAVS